MLIVVSPAKTLDYETPLPISKTSQPAFMKRSAELVDILRDYTVSYTHLTLPTTPYV